MRILSYNILDGGTGRAALLGDVIKGQTPDVVGLVEAEDREVVEQIANRLGMDFIQAPGNKGASALLSRFPIRQSINHAPLHPVLEKSLLEAVVVDPAGAEWTFGVLHLHARATEEDEAIREKEIAEVLKIFEPHRRATRPHMLAGDFNANAPYQQIDPSRCTPKTREAWEKNGGYIPRRVIQRVLDAGYLDSLRVVNPREAETGGTFTTEFPGQRVDYIFTHSIDPNRLQNAWIATAPPARDASDHFPIGLEVA